MPTHSRKPKSTYSLTKLYDGRFCLVLAPSAPPQPSSMQETSRASTSSTQSFSSVSESTYKNQHQPSMQSMSASVSVSTSTSTHLFQPYPSHFPWSRAIASIHRNLYLYKETQAEIIQRDKRIALREAAYTEFHARMAEESRANHVGVTTRSAAAAATAAINGEPPKRSSRVAARINDPVYDALDDLDSPPRKKARTTGRTANNNKISNNSVQLTRNSNTDSNAAKVIKSVTTTPSGDRLTTRSQTRSRRTARRSQTPLVGEVDASAKGNINGDIDETVSKSLNDTKLQSPEIQQAVISEECVPGHVEVENNPSIPQSKYPEEILSPELNTPRTKPGRASSTSSTLASSRQSSDDGYRKSDLRFGDTQSMDGDVNAELGDAELPATANDATASLTRQSTEPPQPCTTSDNLPPCKADDADAKIANDDSPSQSRSQSPALPQVDASRTATKKTEQTKLRSKRSRSRSSYDDDGSENNGSVQSHELTKENADGETNPVESSVVIPPEVRRSGRVLKKRKLE